MFQPVVAVGLDEGAGREVVVWGAGEDLVGRVRARGKDGGVRWVGRRGVEGGWKGGYGDLKGVAVVEWRGGGEEKEVVVTGRDSGEVEMVWGEGKRFGEGVGVRFVLGEEGEGGLETVGSLDVWGGRRVAVAGKTEVVVWGLPVDGGVGDGGEEVEVRPSLVYDLGEKVFRASRRGLQRPQVCRATWMGEGMMALALKGVDDPLRYLELTPTGWTHHTAVKSSRLEEKFGIEYGNLCPSSLTPVQPLASSRSGTNLLLSAWRDGSIRWVIPRGGECAGGLTDSLHQTPRPAHPLRRGHGLRRQHRPLVRHGGAHDVRHRALRRRRHGQPRRQDL